MQTEIYQQILLCIAILVYGVILSRLIPGKFHAWSNAAFALLLLLIAKQLGLSTKDLGISSHYIFSGILVALGISFVVLTTTMALASLPKLQSYFLSQHSILKSSAARISYETLFRIPLVTALFEEFVFRGFLFAVFASSYSILWATVFSSIVFGLWHIFPAINGMNERHYKKTKAKYTERGFVALNVILTSLAGAGFSGLRIISGSIIAPWLLHWTINAGGVVAVLFAKKRSTR